jgi:hypothetical protein
MEDLHRAYEIYGSPVAYIRGKLTKKAISHTIVDPSMIMKERLQTLHTNIMHIDSHKFLVLLVKPLQLTIEAPLKNEMADQLGLGLQGQLSLR